MGEYLEVRGVKTYLEQRGQGEPLLLLHGGTLTIESLSAQAADFSKSYRVILPERRDHGRSSDTAEDLTYDIIGEDVIALMDLLKIKNAILIGHSDGAIISMMIGIVRPDLAKKLVLISANFNFDYLSEKEKTEFKEVSAEDFRSMFPSWARQYDQVAPGGAKHYPITFGKVKKMWTNFDWRIQVNELKKIKTPTLVMSGDRDMIPLAHTIDIFAAIPNAQLCVVPGTSHNLIGEKPDLVNAAIWDFLKQT